MNLLIVDDQPLVTDGLEQGIPWESLGFRNIFKAYNALDARSILLAHPIAVMLCDIQMPVENGLELFAWMRQSGMDTRMIFLTSHAEFEYAQQALKLGSVDYIVQPAPYSDIYNAVRIAVQKVRTDKELAHTARLGQAFLWKEQTIQSSCVVDLLKPHPDLDSYGKLAALDLVPGLSEPVFPVLLYLQQWEPRLPWESGLIDAALSNMLAEIFQPHDSLPVLGAAESRLFVILIPKKEMTSDIVERELRFLASACEQYLDCSLTVYFDAPVLPTQMYSTWQMLQQKCKDNITRETGIFRVSKDIASAHMYRVPEIWQWASLLKDGYGEALEQNACALLDAMVKQRKMTPPSLKAFYLDFMEMLFSTIHGKNISIFNTPESMEIYHNGMKSVSAMKQLIHLVACSCTAGEDDAQDQPTRVKRIVHYINEHLGSELKRDDIAEKMNLSPDYMTRIFKAEMGVSLKEYIIQQKMKHAQVMLRTTTLPINFIAAKVGYSNFSHFSFTYKKALGITPQEERKKAAADS